MVTKTNSMMAKEKKNWFYIIACIDLQTNLTEKETNWKSTPMMMATRKSQIYRFGSKAKNPVQICRKRRFSAKYSFDLRKNLQNEVSNKNYKL